MRINTDKLCLKEIAILDLYEPINVLKPIGKNIWIVDGPIIKMKMIWPIFFPFQTRMTVVKLTNGEIWIHSPIKLDKSLAIEISKHGEIKHIVAPNILHYSYVNEWKEEFPDAITYQAPGVGERAKKHNISINFQVILDKNPIKAWEPDFEHIVFKGSRYMEEVFFFHKSTKTLIVVDMIKNFELEKVSGWFKQVIRLGGFYHPYGRTPPDLQLTFLGRKKTAKKCLDKVLLLKPKQVVLAHGKCYFENAETELKRAFKWIK